CTRVGWGSRGPAGEYFDFW
nr:immunoglobulin heavy chain junction region [Macaca mulatta]MOX92836.1 immunoglobulin heavy chain junction region [Macaca mulatta]MOX93464.1 immunoglobulin heavy chain junction region [Macaca mulatta]MOX95625.1 immunoglobulin heavy chain junction region [Macaca mulatta]MOX96935.1 immunoglobulin heavy chain junction region [Macaca mulatta]